MKVAGRISELPVDLGSAVQKGDVIARLDTTDFELRVRQSAAALEQARVRLGLPPTGTNEDVDLEQHRSVREARATMDGARFRLDRATQLYEKGLMAKSDFDVTNSAYKVTEAQYADALDEARNRQGVLSQRKSELEIARQQLADAVLYAPISGAVRQRNANVGQYVAAGTPIVTLVQMSPLAAENRCSGARSAEYSGRHAGSGDRGRNLHRFTKDASFASALRSMKPIARCWSKPKFRMPPMFSGPALSPAQKLSRLPASAALIVPAAAVVTFAGIDRVFTVHDGKASEKRIKTGRRTDAGIEILEGISAGDQVVINPGNMTDGESVIGDRQVRSCKG